MPWTQSDEADSDWTPQASSEIDIFDGRIFDALIFDASTELWARGADGAGDWVKATT